MIYYLSVRYTENILGRLYIAASLICKSISTSINLYSNDKTDL